MRFDVITIFPKFFDVLNLSLLGKAQVCGTVSVGVHDLRQWAEGAHRSVDDSPYGGGAGMVMRPDVWGKAIDAVRDCHGRSVSETDGHSGVSKAVPRTVLAIPTPSGYPLTQRRVTQLAGADQIIIACGRYEGIDARVAQFYREESGLEVMEYSIGDYVLNGGETAALVLIEATSRLLDGFMSNPQSLTEESFSEPLLEYPAFTRPPKWRGLEVPAILSSGNHAAISAYRRGESLRKTAFRRPDLIRSVDPGDLTSADRRILAQAGWVWQHVDEQWHSVVFRLATMVDLEALVALAQRTFPDACPPQLPIEDVAAHIERHLSDSAVSEWLVPLAATGVGSRVMVAQVGEELVGYTLMLLYPPGECPSDLPVDVIKPAPTYLSKCYVDARWRGSGLADALLVAAMKDVDALRLGLQIVVGTNTGNRRALKFYRRHGFKRVGRRRFTVGSRAFTDVVMAHECG